MCLLFVWAGKTQALPFVFDQAEEAFAASLYTLMSDEAVHPVVADHEYARLFRNVVIEYALLFLSKLDKLGLKRQPVRATTACGCVWLAIRKRSTLTVCWLW